MELGLVSIITPMYNGEKFVKYTIESVLSQSYPLWEMIIIDDGSKDNGPQIVEEYAKNDSRITLIRQPNKGSAAARNNGINLAKGQYIALLDSDDTWEPNFLEEQIKLMNEKSCNLVYSSHKRIDENGNETLKPFIVPESVTYKDLLKTNSISCLTGLYNTKDHGKVYLKEDLKSLRDDYVYWLEIIKKEKVAYGNQKILASYRVMNTTVTGNKKKMIKPQFLVYYKHEKLGLIRSCYYLANWALNGYFKYKK